MKIGRMTRVEIESAVKRMRDDGNLMTIAERDTLIEGLAGTLYSIERVLGDERDRQSESAWHLAERLRSVIDRGVY